MTAASSSCSSASSSSSPTAAASSELEDRLGLALAEAESAEGEWRQRRTSDGAGKACRGPIDAPAAAASRLRIVSPAAIESCWHATALSRHSKAVREAGRLETAVALGELVEHGVARGARVESQTGRCRVRAAEPTRSARQSRRNAACERPARATSSRGALAAPTCVTATSRGAPSDEQRTAVRASIPSVGFVLGSSAERPDGQVESERGPRTQLEPTLLRTPPERIAVAGVSARPSAGR